MSLIRMGLYGINGHQLPLSLPPQVRARVVAVAGFPPERIPADSQVRRYESLAELIADPEIDLIVLCSPRRSEQANEARMCMEGGKHVLAEKPCAMSDAELDELLAVSARTGMCFHEMADSLLEPPVRAIRELVEGGALGEIVHVQAHKSYPWMDSRPQDFDTDGGLTRWIGIHALRYIIASTGLRVREVSAAATNVGNPGAGNIHIAGAFAMTLNNGAVASMNLNYLNPRSFGVWGNDQIRVFGTKGMAEAVDGFQRGRLYPAEGEGVALPPSKNPVSPLLIEHYVNHLLEGTPMPFDEAEEWAALRASFAAHEAAMTGEKATVRE